MKAIFLSDISGAAGKLFLCEIEIGVLKKKNSKTRKHRET